MNPQRPWQAFIELDLRCQPVGGVVRDSSGSPTSFTGWLGLIAAINALRDGAPGLCETDISLGQE